MPFHYIFSIKLDICSWYISRSSWCFKRVLWIYKYSISNPDLTPSFKNIFWTFKIQTQVFFIFMPNFSAHFHTLNRILWENISWVFVQYYYWKKKIIHCQITISDQYYSTHSNSQIDIYLLIFPGLMEISLSVFEILSL